MKRVDEREREGRRNKLRRRDWNSKKIRKLRGKREKWGDEREINNRKR